MEDTLSAAGSGSGQASHVHVDDEVDEGDEASDRSMARLQLPGIAQLLVGRTVVHVGGPCWCPGTCKQVGIGHREDVLQTSNITLSVSMFSGNCWPVLHHAVAEQVAVVLSRTAVVADDGQLLVDHHAQTSEQSHLSGWTDRCRQNPRSLEAALEVSVTLVYTSSMPAVSSQAATSGWTAMALISLLAALTQQILGTGH